MPKPQYGAASLVLVPERRCAVVQGCCYQCFRQVFVASAFHLEPEEVGPGAVGCDRRADAAQLTAAGADLSGLSARHLVGPKQAPSSIRRLSWALSSEMGGSSAAATAWSALDRPPLSECGVFCFCCFGVTLVLKCSECSMRCSRAEVLEQWSRWPWSRESVLVVAVFLKLLPKALQAPASR